MELKNAVQALVLDALRDTGAVVSDRVDLDTPLDDIDFDSLALTAVVARAESDYDMEFSSAHVLRMYQSMRVVDLAQAIEDAIVDERTRSSSRE